MSRPVGLRRTNPDMTLGDYRDAVVDACHGDENNKAVQYFDKKIAEEGRDARVLADPSQMIILVLALLLEDEQ